jgi:hypothetical protein
MGKAEGQGRAKEVLGASEERQRPKADKPGSAEEVIGTGESALGCCKEGWGNIAIDSKSSGAAFRLVGFFQLSPDLDKQKATKPSKWDFIGRFSDTGLRDRVRYFRLSGPVPVGVRPGPDFARKLALN